MYTSHPIEITLFQLFRTKEENKFAPEKNEGTPSPKSWRFRRVFYNGYHYHDKTVPWCWGKSGEEISTDYQVYE